MARGAGFGLRRAVRGEGREAHRGPQEAEAPAPHQAARTAGLLWPELAIGELGGRGFFQPGVQGGQKANKRTGSCGFERFSWLPFSEPKGGAVIVKNSQFGGL